MGGEHAKFFFIWCWLLRFLKIKMVVAENVVQFGHKPYEEELGDMFVIMTVRVSANLQGWATERVRQMTLLFYKPWIFGCLRACQLPASAVFLEKHLAIEQVLRNVFGRVANYGWDRYVLASVDELQAELEWAHGRTRPKQQWKKVGKKWQKIHWTNPAPLLQGTKETWHTDAFYDALNPSEQARLKVYRELYPHDVCDLSQDPEEMPVFSRDMALNTIIKNVGIMYLPEFYMHGGAAYPDGIGLRGPRMPKRWLTLSELLTSMGFPITYEAIQACCGATCPMSRGQPIVPGQSHRSTANQTGNTMHVNSIGAIRLTIFLLLPSLGTTFFTQGVPIWMMPDGTAAAAAPAQATASACPSGTAAAAAPAQAAASASSSGPSERASQASQASSSSTSRPDASFGASFHRELKRARSS